MNSFSKKSISRLVKIDYSELNSKSLLSKIEEAFGIKNGLGLICIQNIPKFESLRYNLLNNGYKLANLKNSELETLERSELNYIYGWSKAKSATHKTKDYRLACFYQKASDCGEKIDVWPDCYIPDFKKSFSEYCNIVTSCQIKLLRHLDDYSSSVNKYYVKNTLLNSCSPLNNAIGRLLMYYPEEHKDLNIRKKELIGWHRDVANLTALPHPMYFNRKGEIKNNVKSGIIVKDKNKNEIEIEYKENELIIQIGDLGFILSGGCLVSTPHCAMNSQDSIYDLYRITIALFMEPQDNYLIKIPSGISQKELFENDPYANEYKLTTWTGDTTYKDFLMKANEKVYTN